MKISFFYPCHNEEANIEKLIEQTYQFAQNRAKDKIEKFEIIAVDDGSQDRTAEIVNGLSKKYPEVRLVQHPKNKGYGAALITGFRSAKYEYIFYTDGDGQFVIEELAKHLDKINSGTVLSGYRADRKDPLMRKINAFVFNVAYNIFFLNTFRDIDCSFKVYPRWAIEKINMRCTGALIDGEMLVKSKRLGLKVVQFPVEHLPRLHGIQSGAKLKVILKAMREFIFLWFHIKTWTVTTFRRVI